MRKEIDLSAKLSLRAWLTTQEPCRAQEIPNRRRHRPRRRDRAFRTARRLGQQSRRSIVVPSLDLSLNGWRTVVRINLDQTFFAAHQLISQKTSGRLSTSRPSPLHQRRCDGQCVLGGQDVLENGGRSQSRAIARIPPDRFRLKQTTKSWLTCALMRHVAPQETNIGRPHSQLSHIDGQVHFAGTVPSPRSVKCSRELYLGFPGEPSALNVNCGKSPNDTLVDYMLKVCSIRSFTSRRRGIYFALNLKFAGPIRSPIEPHKGVPWGFDG